MKKISAEQIRKLRDATGAPMVRVKQVLEKTEGVEKKAEKILRKEGFEAATKKVDRETKAGVVETYIHATRASGATVVMATETDFVARNPDFQKLAREVAMQITAMDPKDVNELLKQPYIRDEKKTVDELIKENITKFGENIKVTDFKRFQV